MKKNRTFQDGNIIVLKEPYEYIKGLFTKIFEYETWDLDGAAFRPYHKGTCTHFRMVDDKGNELSPKQIMERTAEIWENEQEFFQKAGPQLGMYEFGNDLYQVIQKSGGKVSALCMSKGSTNQHIYWQEFYLQYWIDVFITEVKPVIREKLITRIIEDRTPEAVPFDVICIDSDGVADLFTEGQTYYVKEVIFRKGKKHYVVQSNRGTKISPNANRFVRGGDRGFYELSNKPKP